jgi:hypothetical protein
MFFKKNKYNIYFYLCILLILFIIISSFYYNPNTTINNTKTNEKFVTLTDTSAKFIAGVEGGETWTVPDGITQATFIVIGGKGGDGFATYPNYPSFGGDGTKVKTTLSNLKSGDTYNIYVGNNGGSMNLSNYVSGLGGSSSDPGKLFSGGDGHNNNYTGGGGAASYITDSTNKPIIVAGGGGGGGQYTNGGNGGAMPNGNGGDGGFRSNYCTLSPIFCSNGSGGSISSTTYTSNVGAVGNSNSGGGGGGYYGGNSIGEFTGGGGGGSFVISTNSNNTKFISDKSGTPYILIDWSPVIIPTETFDIGESGKWIVPYGVTQATFTVIGGKGGDGYSNGNHLASGGSGSNVITTLSNLNSGDIYNIYVGNNGRSMNSYYYTSGFGGISSDPGKLFSGGNGNAFNTGGGGAASFITDTSNTVIIVAGGGGGGGHNANGGDGGAMTNGNGGFGSALNCNEYNPLHCATGSGGSVTSTTYTSNVGAVGNYEYTGGGGGGYHGGNSIGRLTGGGGGGSYVISTNSSNTTFSTDTSRVPSIIIRWSDGLSTKTTQPSTTQPSTTQPSTTQPSTTQPSTTQPSTTQPLTTIPFTTTQSSTRSSITRSTSIRSVGSINIPLETYGFKVKDKSNTSPDTQIYQHNFEGTSNVYSPSIYYNMESYNKEIFTPLNYYDDYYAPY